MADNNEKKVIDSDELRKSLVEILEFENKSKSYLKELEDDKDKSQEEKEKLKNEFKEKGKVIELKRESFLKSIEGRNVQDLEEIIKVLQMIYVEQRDLKHQVKKLLTETAFRKQIQILRNQDFARVYTLIEFICNKFPVDDYPMYTLKPDAVLYGSEVEKTAKSSVYLSPLGNEEILTCLEVFAEKNPGALYNWVMAIYSFDAELIVSSFKDKYLKERQELLLQVIEKTKKDVKFQNVISAKLFEKGDLARIVNLQLAGNKAEKQVKELEEKIREMTVTAEEKEKSYWERADRQKGIIDEKEALLEKMRAKIANYDEMSARLTDLTRRYEAQVKANEMLVIESDIRIHEMEEREKTALNENQKLQTELTELRNLFENVKSDLTLKIAEINRITESSGETEARARESVLYELVSSMKEQLYYILLFHEELVENGSLEKDSIDMFGDTIQNINDAFRELGVEIYGKLDESVEYDSSLHDSMGYKLGNVEKAIIRVPGWKISGAVYAKAQVEKEN